jgi:Leucine-rich repeat (LRR) protein
MPARKFPIAFLALLLLAAFPTARAQTTATATPAPPAQRTLHFPTGYSLGSVSIDAPDLEIPSRSRPGRVDDTAWTFLAPAKGDVRIPAGRRVKLTATGRIWDDPQCSADLGRLGPDGIYSLTLSAMWMPPGKANASMDACMPHIAALAGLRELNLTQTRISSEALKQLPRLKNLTALDTPDNLTPAGLAEILKIKSLQSLTINANQLVDNNLLQLQQLPQLAELGLTAGRFSDQCLAHVAALPHMTHLTLGDTVHGDTFPTAVFSDLRKSTSLKALRIGSLSFNDDAMLEVSQIPQLEQLNVYWQENITDRGVAGFADHPALKSLSTGRSKLTDASLSVLSRIPTLESLTLPGAGFSDDGVALLAGLKNLKSLDIGMSGNSSLTDRSLRAITQWSSLERLSTGGRGMTDDGIAQLAKLNRLRHLLLSGVTIADDGFQAIGELKDLESLSLSPAAPITVAQINHLNSLPFLKTVQLSKVTKDQTVLNLTRLKNLESLQLAMERVADKKLSRLIPVSFLANEDMKGFAGLDRLTSLQIVGIKIDDTGFQTLARLKSIQFLNLVGPTAITDKSLAAIATNSPLSRLTVDQGHFTAIGLRAFRNRKPMESLTLTSDQPLSAGDNLP